MPAPTVTIAIVSWNTRGLLAHCLESLAPERLFDLLNESPGSRGELAGYDELTKLRSNVEAAQATAFTQTAAPPLTDLQREYHQARATVLSLQRLADPALLRGIAPVA